MKKHIVFILIFNMHVCYSQLTMQPVPGITGVAQSYGLATWSQESSASPHFIEDPGTMVYFLYANVGNGGIHRSMYILRQNNYWKIMEHQSGPWIGEQYLLTYINTVPSSDINPPCNGLWESNQGNSYSSATLPSEPKGHIVQIQLSGTSCVTLPSSSSFTALPTHVNLPLIMASDIVNIPNPKTGMMTYDITNQCVKVFSNGIWTCIN